MLLLNNFAVKLVKPLCINLHLTTKLFVILRVLNEFCRQIEIETLVKKNHAYSLIITVRVISEEY